MSPNARDPERREVWNTGIRDRDTAAAIRAADRAGTICLVAVYPPTAQSG